MKKIYETQVVVKGGREGHAKSSDGKLEVSLGLPPELGGSKNSTATNPEQLFGAGYAACFESALRFVARNEKVTIQSAGVTATVSLSAKPEGGFQLGAKLAVELPGLDRSVAQKLIDLAHQTCPYSNAIRGNVDVEIQLI
jgi:osmotically inducible protein OsmC